MCTFSLYVLTKHFSNNIPHFNSNATMAMHPPGDFVALSWHNEAANNTIDCVFPVSEVSELGGHNGKTISDLR